MFAVKLLKSNTTLRSEHSFYESVDSGKIMFCQLAALAEFLLSCFPHYALILAGNKLYLGTKGLFGTSNKNYNSYLIHIMIRCRLL